MSERRTIRVPAPRGSHFDPQAAENAVGDEFPLNVEGRPYGTARCVAADVLDDGKALALTLEADSFPGSDLGEPHFSFDVDAMENDPLNRGQRFPRS